ncbi:MAG: hypothetical protein GXP27_08550 [Planctomycetes bacterium]|nr:hypothetical protein [Planctomycetota bacterium]
MPAPGYGHTQEQTPGPGLGQGPVQKPGHSLDNSVQKALQYDRDFFRTPRASRIIPLLEQAVEKESTQDESELEMEEGLPVDATEISLADEDDMDSDASSSPDSGPQWVTADASSPADEWRCDLHDRIPIIVKNARAVFQIPDWGLEIAHDDLDCCWQTYAAIAEWLNRDKQDFLRKMEEGAPGKEIWPALTAGPIDVAGPIPVLQQGLHKLLDLPYGKETFTKHVALGIILWPNREFPLHLLWSKEAQWAWFAQAVIQRQHRAGGYVGPNDPLGIGKPSIQPPRSSNDREELRRLAGKADELSSPRYVKLLCILTKCTWRDVLERYRDRIFYKG